MGQEIGDDACIGRAAGRQFPAGILRQAATAAEEIIHGGIGRAGVEGEAGAGAFGAGF